MIRPSGHGHIGSRHPATTESVGFRAMNMNSGGSPWLLVRPRRGIWISQAPDILCEDKASPLVSFPRVLIFIHGFCFHGFLAFFGDRVRFQGNGQLWEHRYPCWTRVLKPVGQACFHLAYYQQLFARSGICHGYEWDISQGEIGIGAVLIGGERG